MFNLMELFKLDRSPAVALSTKEIAVLEGIRRAGGTGICAADLQVSLTREIGREPRLATLYGTLTDLEKKGLIGNAGTSLAENGGRPRRLFMLTKAGELAHELGTLLFARNGASALA